MSNPATQFQPGNNANPHGRPKKEWTMKSLIQKALEEEVEIKNKLGQVTGKKAIKEIIAKKLAQLAAQGDMTAIKEVNNRIDGMPQQDITSDGEKIEAPVVFIPQEKNE